MNIFYILLYLLLTNNEFYIAPTYNYMIAKKKVIRAHNIKPEEHKAVGTPEDLELFKKHRAKQLGFDPEKLIGLRYIPDLGETKNNLDKIKSKERDKYYVRNNFSKGNSEVLRSVIKEFKPRNILEIGVNNSKSYDHSSTFNFMEYLKKDKSKKTLYLGVDINRQNIRQVISENTELFWPETCQRMFFHEGDSAEFDKISNIIENKLSSRLDLILIDGWHSVNQVLKEWRLLKYLNKRGVVILHDTNNHPGPFEVVAAADPNFFKEIRQPFKGKYEDWGLTVLVRK